jgi:transposase-like protein
VEGKQFQKLIEQLGELSAVQRSALLEAVRGGKPADEAIALIETRFAAAPACGHCGSTAFGTWGMASSLKRFKCKAEGCQRTFNALTGTPLAQLHRRDAWLDYARALGDGISLRKAAARCSIDLTTSFRWRHRFLKAQQEAKPAKVEGIVEADETFFLTSAKGSRKLVGRAPRKRGGKAKKPGTSEEQVPVLIIRDRHGATTDAKLTDLQGDTIKAILRTVVARDALLVSDGAKVYGSFAREIGIEHKAVVASRGVHVVDGIYHIQNVNGYTSRLKGWMARFNGVASKYLKSYLGWRRLIEREGLAMTPRRWIACALG